VPDFSLSEASTPERLIAGIIAGKTVGIDAGDCAFGKGGKVNS